MFPRDKVRIYIINGTVKPEKHNCRFGVLRFGALLSLSFTEDFLLFLWKAVSLFSFESGFVLRDGEAILRTPLVSSPCKVHFKPTQFNKTLVFEFLPCARHLTMYPEYEMNKKFWLQRTHNLAPGGRLSFIHSFNKYILSDYYVPGSNLRVLGLEL